MKCPRATPRGQSVATEVDRSSSLRSEHSEIARRRLASGSVSNQGVEMLAFVKITFIVDPTGGPAHNREMLPRLALLALVLGAPVGYACGDSANSAPPGNATDGGP